MRGTSPNLTRRVFAEHDPLPGTAGSTDELDDRLVRDVFNHQPPFSEHANPAKQSFGHHDPDDPIAVPVGRIRQTTGEAADDDKHVQSFPDSPAATDRDTALDHVHDTIFESVRSVDDDGLTVAFSGGIDSTIVATGVPGTPCYVAGSEGSHNIAAAREIATAMDHGLTVIELTHEAPERAVPEIIVALDRTTPMDMQIVLPLYLLAERAATDGYDRLAVGQGADELLGGYTKAQKAPGDPRVEADIVRGATREMALTLPNQLGRDLFVLRVVGVDPVAPLLHDRVVSATLPLSEELPVDGDRRKVALREAASGVLPGSVAGTDRKAVQCGTYTSRELDWLAWQAGFKRRMENHVQQYVKSLAE